MLWRSEHPVLSTSVDYMHIVCRYISLRIVQMEFTPRENMNRHTM